MGELDFSGEDPTVCRLNEDGDRKGIVPVLRVIGQALLVHLSRVEGEVFPREFDL